MNNEIGQYLSAKELAEILGISKSCFFALVRRGVLPKGVRIGHSRRWAASDIERALQDMALQAMKGAIE